MENCGFKIDIENIDNDSFKFRIKVEKECWIPKNSTREEWKNCMDKNELTVDYVSVFVYLYFCEFVYLYFCEFVYLCICVFVWKNCRDKNELTVDYVSVWFPLHDANIYKWKQNFNIKLYLFQTCRFSLFGYKCFCCGAFFHYLEHVRNIMQIFSPHM